MLSLAKRKHPVLPPPSGPSRGLGTKPCRWRMHPSPQRPFFCGVYGMHGGIHGFVVWETINFMGVLLVFVLPQDVQSLTLHSRRHGTVYPAMSIMIKNHYSRLLLTRRSRGLQSTSNELNCQWSTKHKNGILSSPQHVCLLDFIQSLDFCRQVERATKITMRFETYCRN